MFLTNYILGDLIAFVYSLRCHIYCIPTAPVFAAVETVVAALLGAVLYGEWLDPVRLFGIVLVLLSIALLSLRRA